MAAERAELQRAFRKQRSEKRLEDGGGGGDGGAVARAGSAEAADPPARPGTQATVGDLPSPYAREEIAADDLASLPTESTAFRTLVLNFHTARAGPAAAPFFRVPHFSGRELDLQRLFRLVLDRGGGAGMSGAADWRQVVRR